MFIHQPQNQSSKFNSWIEYLLHHENGAILTHRSTDTVKVTHSSKKKTDIIESILSEPALPIVCRKSSSDKTIAILHSFLKIGGTIRNPTKSYFALSSLDNSIKIVRVNLENLLASCEFQTPPGEQLKHLDNEDEITPIETSESLTNKFQGRKCIAIPPIFLATLVPNQAPTKNYIELTKIMKELQEGYENDESISSNDSQPKAQNPKNASNIILGYFWGLCNNKVDFVQFPSVSPPPEVIQHYQNLHKNILTQQHQVEEQEEKPLEENSSDDDSLAAHHQQKRQRTSLPSSNSAPPSFTNAAILKELSRLRSSAEILATNQIQFQRDSIIQKEEKKIKITQASKDLILTASQHNEHHVVQDFAPSMKEFLSCKSETIARQLITQKLVRLEQIPIHLPQGTVSALFNGFFIWPSPSEIKHFTLFSFPPYEEGEKSLSDDSEYDLQLAIQRKDGNEKYDKQQIRDLLKQDLFIPKTIDGLI